VFGRVLALLQPLTKLKIATHVSSVSGQVTCKSRRRVMVAAMSFSKLYTEKTPEGVQAKLRNSPCLKSSAAARESRLDAGPIRVQVLWRRKDRLKDGGAAARGILPSSSSPGRRAQFGKLTGTAEAVKTNESVAHRIVTCCRLLLHPTSYRFLSTSATITSSCLIWLLDRISKALFIRYNKFIAFALPTSLSSGGVSTSASLLSTLDPTASSVLETCQVIVCMIIFS